MIRHSDRADQSDLDHFLQQACHSSLRASVNHTHILDMGKGGELMKLKKMQVGPTCWLRLYRVLGRGCAAGPGECLWLGQH